MSIIHHATNSTIPKPPRTHSAHKHTHPLTHTRTHTHTHTKFQRNQTIRCEVTAI